jgi:hypothetical protein
LTVQYGRRWWQRVIPLDDPAFFFRLQAKLDDCIRRGGREPIRERRMTLLFELCRELEKDPDYLRAWTLGMDWWRTPRPSWWSMIGQPDCTQPAAQRQSN